MTLEELIDAWGANCALNRELLALCADEDFELKPGKGKTIRSKFVHIVGNRRFHIEEKLRRESEAVPKLDWKTATREEILDGLAITDELVAALFSKLHEATKPGRWTTLRFFAYMVAHDVHHRSQIELSLRLNGREPEDRHLYALWDWPKKQRG